MSTETSSSVVTKQKKVICKKCKSDQIVANKRGYSFKNFFLAFLSFVCIGVLSGLLVTIFDISPLYIGFPAVLIFLGLPIGLISGFVGRSNIVNACMGCGNKWMPGK